MPFVDGKWVPEEQSVSKRVTGLIKDDPEFVQRARADAAKLSNRRGLLNTSIAVQASEEAAQKAALPIASQEAAQAQEANLQQAGFEQETAEAIADRTFRSSEAALERTGRAGLLETELTSRRESEEEQRGFAASESELARVQQRFSEAERIKADRALAERGIVANEVLAQMDSDTRVDLANLSVQSQEAIAALNVHGNDRLKATEALVNISAQYEDAFTKIQNNPNIPAEARANSLEHIARIRDSNNAMIQALYQIPIVWESPAFWEEPPPNPSGGTEAPPPPPPTTGTTPPPTVAPDILYDEPSSFI